MLLYWLVSAYIHTYSSDDYQLCAFMNLCDVCGRECELVIVYVCIFLICIILLYYACFNLHLCILVLNIHTVSVCSMLYVRQCNSSLNVCDGTYSNLLPLIVRRAVLMLSY